MSKINVKKTHKSYAVILCAFLVLLTLGISLAIGGAFIFKGSENSSRIEVKVDTIDKMDDQYYIMSNGKMYKFQSGFNPNEIITTNDDVVIYINTSSLILSLYKDKMLYDITYEYERTGKIMFIIGMSFTAISIVGYVMFRQYRINRPNDTEEKEFIDYYLNSAPFPQYISRYDKDIKKTHKFIRYLIICFILFFTISISSFIIIADNYERWTFLYLIPIITFVLSLLCIILCQIPYGYRKKDLKKFVSKYIKFLNEPSKEESDVSNIFMDDGLFVEIENRNEIIPYETLKFFTVVVYIKQFQSAYIFICSSYETELLPSGALFLLDNNIYNRIKDINLKIEKLDYVLDNLESEIITNLPKQGQRKVVKYNE